MPESLPRRRLRRLLVACFLLTGLGSAAAYRMTGLPVPATLNDFFLPGTQPLTLNAPLEVAQNCSACHGFYDAAHEPYRRWQASLMAQAARDPIFHACLTIAEQDMQFVGDTCLRCHAPNGWLDGRSVPTDGSALDHQLGDFDGVSCHFCHRMVDPVYRPGASPIDDAAILAALGQIPPNPHSGSYVVDPEDRRRGPFDLGPGFFWHEWRQSPFHRDSALCGTCHDVSNPAFTRQPDGSYALNATDTPHPTHDKYDAFPMERTYSEWLRSDFAKGPIEMGGRFGGNRTAVSSCQDCHMPAATGHGCAPGFGGPLRSDLPLHDFAGGNTWVLRAVRSLYPDYETGLDQQMVDESIARALAMLASSADLHVFLRGGQLVARVVNQSGHKLPTGYPEGRRMWINVRFFDASSALVAERGAYELATAVLTQDTTVFEAKLGLDAAMAVETGLPPGESFHFALNNVVLKDNRVPPRGFTNPGFEAVQAAPVGAAYLEQQYWSDSAFDVPAGSVTAEVRLYYQTTSKEYVEFLRDANTTNGSGQIAYDQWVLHGKSEPALVQQASLDLSAAGCPDPIPYGFPRATSGGSTPSVAWTGTPSFAQNDFRLRVDDSVPYSFGALLWSAAPATGALGPGWGTLLLAAPQVRVATFQTGATGSSGWIPVPVEVSMVGTERYFQFFVRDPAGRGGTNLSPALHVDFCQ